MVPATEAVEEQAAFKLAEKVKKPIKERRNPYRDNENEEKLLQM